MLADFYWDHELEHYMVVDRPGDPTREATHREIHLALQASWTHWRDYLHAIEPVQEKYRARVSRLGVGVRVDG